MLSPNLPRRDLRHFADHNSAHLRQEALKSSRSKETAESLGRSAAKSLGQFANRLRCTLRPRRPLFRSSPRALYSRRAIMRLRRDDGIECRVYLSVRIRDLGPVPREVVSTRTRRRRRLPISGKTAAHGAHGVAIRRQRLCVFYGAHP